MYLYFLGLSCLSTVLYYLHIYLDSDDSKSIYLKTAAIIGFVGECSVFLGLSLCVRLALTIALNRNGGERPKTLTCTSEGGWDVDQNQTFEYFVFFGEIEVIASKGQCDNCYKTCSYQLNQALFARDPL